MNKRCTNPSCRKTFSTLRFSGRCPHCGKEYPQMESIRNKFFEVRILDPHRYKVRTIKRIRDIFQLGLREAKDNIDQAPNVVYILENVEALPFVQELTEIGTTFEMRRTRRKHKMILHSH